MLLFSGKVFMHTSLHSMEDNACTYGQNFFLNIRKKCHMSCIHNIYKSHSFLLYDKNMYEFYTLEIILNKILRILIKINNFR